MIMACSRIRDFLPKGVYRIRNKRIKKGFGIPFFIVRNCNSSDVIQEKQVTFYYGGWSEKIVAFAGSRVYSFYSENEIGWLKNLKKYYKYIVYPKSVFFLISDEQHYTITDFTPGKSFFDLQHCIYLAKEMIKYASTASTIEKPSKYNFIDGTVYKNINYYVQHGDLAAKNVLWTSDTDYCVIDFDTIEVFPVFYDFFRVIIVELKEKGVQEYLNGTFDLQIKEYMQINDIDGTVDSFKDESLAAFVLTTYKYWFTDKIISGIVPESYKKTMDVIQSCNNR